MRSAAIIVARLIFACVFGLAAWFKVADMAGTAKLIASAGFPASLALAWLATAFEAVLAIGFLTGLFFREVAAVAALYVLFLAFTFHGPASWTDKMAFGLCLDHLTFIAGLLYAAVHGPGDTLVVRTARSDRLDAAQ